MIRIGRVYSSYSFLYMPHTIELTLHHTKEELLDLYKKTRNPTERTRLHFLSIVRSDRKNDATLAVSLQTAMKRVGMKLTWAQDTIRRYNKSGIHGLEDMRKQNKRPRFLSKEQENLVREQIASHRSPDDGLWTGHKVAKYLGEITGKETNAVTGWRYLQYLGFSLQVPRLAHEKRATPEEQEAFKKNSKILQKQPDKNTQEKL